MGDEQQVYRVTGMTCEHCRSAVRDEVAAVAGVTDVSVDLAAGTVTIRGRDVRQGDVARAVEEAGYELAR